MSFESYQLKNVDILETHPGRVTRKDVSMEGMVRSTSSVGHSDFHPFTNPQMHERRPNPLRFHRQMKFFQMVFIFMFYLVMQIAFQIFPFCNI